MSRSLVNDRQRISRRKALTGAAFALSAAATPAAIAQVSARQKISQADAKYQGTPKGDQRCDGCISFQLPNACKFVQGDISPSGWCQLFAPKMPKDLKP
ncbi:MAG: high potential iron sulfur protein [Xanthobacteraceae bacterium]